MGKTINYYCPNCGASILHEVDDNGSGRSKELCGCCQSEFSIDELKKSAQSGKAGYNSAADKNGEAMVAYIDDSESAFAYLENYFELYDWDSFVFTSAVAIPEVKEMVKKMLIKSAAKPATWELNFTSIATPLQKKLSGLKKLEAKFFEEYAKAEDVSDCFEYFDIYAKVVDKLIADESIIKELETAIKYHTKYKGEASVTKAMTAQLEAIKKDIAALKPIKDYKALSGFSKAQTERQKRIVQKLAAQNIDAEQLYASAVEEAKKGGDVRNALGSFKKIAGYKDSSEYAAKLNGYLRFNMSDGVFIKLGKKHYVFREQKSAVLDVANIQKKNQNVEEQTMEDTVKRFEMFEIIGKRQAPKSCVKRVTRIIYFFGGHLIFVKDNASICSFDSNAPVETAEKVILPAKRGDILIDNIFERNNRLFIQKKLDAVKDKKGCLEKIFKFKKATKQEVLTANNYSLIALDLVSDKLVVVIPEMVDVQDKFGDEIFFTKVTSIADGDIKEELFSYNYITKRTKAVLNAETEIVDVIDGNVIYFVWTPNDYNKDLHSLDLKTGIDTTLDTNVFEYCRTIEKKPYYYIGNDTKKTLYRINVDGSGRQEISNNAAFFDKVVRVKNGKIYFTYGYGLNTALYKMNTDGKGCIILCPHFKREVEIRDGYVYYIDQLNNLCCVREDGEDHSTILDGIGNFIQVTKDAIYLLRKEAVDEDASGIRFNSSLYKVNLDGKGLEKIAFNVNNAFTNPSDKNEIYLYKVNQVTYSIAVPVNKKDYETHFETKTLRSLAIYNVLNMTFNEVAVFGKPVEGKYEFKGGCLKKDVSKRAIIKEVPNKKTFKRSGKAKAGAVAKEQLAQTSTPAAKDPAKSAAKDSAKSVEKKKNASNKETADKTAKK